MRGLFITFEGTEGSGKTTQSAMLAEFLKRRGFKVLHLREPGSTNLGEQIRGVLLKSYNRISPAAETFLYLAARAELVAEKIAPALKKGMIVICDRFADATVSYQGYGLGVELKLIERLNNFATKGITPDLTFFLDADVKRGLKRSLKIKGFADRIERRSYDFHRRVRNGYIALAKKFPRRIKMISVERENKQETQSIIREVVLDAIERDKRPGKGR